MFSIKSTQSLTKGVLTKNSPVYVQFYITARCNLTCVQCNIRYANADMRECTLDEIKRIAENFAKMNVAMVLLTGGEPFTRTDLPEIIREFESRGVHVRMQTNGLASEEAIHKVVEYGGRDISISLDSINPLTQDAINGGFPQSWHRALKAMAHFTKYLPKEKSFASLGCVLQRKNLYDIEDVIKFGTAIGWFTSLVPIHVSTNFHPLGFRSYDTSLRFKPEEYKGVDKVVERVRSMRTEGYLLYDSDQYLDDIKRFVRNESTSWRSKNNNVCDSPNLYFAILPNGSFSPCCDWRMPSAYYTYSSDFPQVYRDHVFRKEVFAITSACSGCMYGSYPEMTISMRFLDATVQRIKTFITEAPKKPWPLTYENMLATVEKLSKKKH
ncbi:MAG: radical SAM protein [Patescibacteria group bacterium]|jgi:MoaA/NifB/PqqE/SkfB family radical SAM enzyme